MVSLIDHIGYLKEYEDKPKIKSFIELINGRTIVATSDPTNEMDKIYSKMIIALSSNSKKDFISAYEDFTRRKPSEESPWLYNDFLVFVILIGIVKYFLKRNWIEGVLSLRSNSNTDFQAINQTLKNVLSGNLTNTDNLHEIVIVYLDILNQPQLSRELLDTTYLKLSNQSDLLEKHNDFLAVMSLRAYDVIITTKDTPDAIEVKNLRNFKVDFEKRVSIIGDVIYFSILTTLVVLIFIFYTRSQDFKDFINDLGAVFSIIGIALLTGIQLVRKWIKRLIKALFGFSRNFSRKKD
ncbi:hypothetical protein GYB22_03410 [bacterium]|nr:hypothetical protein [bacterium]